MEEERARFKYCETVKFGEINNCDKRSSAASSSTTNTELLLLPPPPVAEADRC